MLALPNEPLRGAAEAPGARRRGRRAERRSFSVLGRHPAPAGGPAGAIIRTLQPAASAVEVVTGDRVVPMERRRPEGLFVAVVPWDGPLERAGYVLRVHDAAGVRDLIDPYQFGPVLTDFDLHLFSEGRHYRAWEQLGLAAPHHRAASRACTSPSGRRTPSASA